jgi:hypothetical protein
VSAFETERDRIADAVRRSRQTTPEPNSADETRLAAVARRAREREANRLVREVEAELERDQAAPQDAAATSAERIAEAVRVLRGLPAADARAVADRIRGSL